MKSPQTEAYIWPEWRMRYLLRQRPTTEQMTRLALAKQVSFVPMEAIGENGGINLTIIRDKEEVEKGFTLFFDGDVIVAKITPCFENYKGAIAEGLYSGVAYGTTELYVLNPRPDLDNQYLFYLTISDSFRKLGEASMKGAAGQKRVPENFIRDFRLKLPPLQDQQRIAGYLGKETYQIDILINEKRRMLSLLEEKRAALISRAVTCGLDPGISLKPSGYSWLGDIPAHWKVMRCASLFKEIDERNQPDLPLLNVSLNTGVTLRVFSDNKIESVAADFASYKVARKGNLAFNKMRFWQGAVGVAPEDGLVSPDYTVAKFGPGLYADYIEVLFRIPQFIMEVRRHSHGIVDDRLRLYWDGFKNIHIPVPPLSEQKNIAEYLLNERRQGAEIEAALNKSIKLLQERRGALITAAVTGQIEPEAMKS